MPELPDVTLYVESLRRVIGGATLQGVRLSSPFLLRTVEPPLTAAVGRRLTGVRRLGKRIVFELEDTLFLAFHPMRAGRLRWSGSGRAPPKKITLAALEFSTGTVYLTEAGSKRRAALHLFRDETALASLHAGGLEVLGASLEAFRAALLRENHTLKRAITDQRLFSGIGNAYSDEILHAARLSPVQLTSNLDENAIIRLWEAMQATLTAWIDRLREEVGHGFPEKVTAFRECMAVHGRYGEPCPVCRAPVQRIVYADSETNYCPRCQTGGRILADRALSRLLRGDWPRRLEDLEG